MTENNYQICNNCIMDTTDPNLKFDERGWCDYCQNFYRSILPNWNYGVDQESKILPTINKIKEDGKGKPYDCIIGISGGLDSTYVTHVAVKKFDLRPLMFHCDTGWNSRLGVSNIKKLMEGLNLDLVTDVVNWQEMKDLQRAFFKSGVSFVDTPQDLALFSAMYNFAAKENFKYVITGGNHLTESVRECLNWTYFSTDTKHVRDIHNKYGEKKLDTFPSCDIFKYKFYYRFIKGMRIIKLLDYVSFSKQGAIEELRKQYDWEPYQQKHYESRFTKFYESFWTTTKFGYDKRRAYLSSLILSKQITRKDAIEHISTPELSEEEMNNEFEYVAKKLDFTIEEFKAILDSPNKSYKDYKNNEWLILLGSRIANALGIDNRKFG